MYESLKNVANKIDKVSDVSGKLTSFLVIFLALVVFYGAFTRYLLKDMPSWAYEVAIFAYGTIAFFSGGYCLLHNKHVAVDIIKSKINKKHQKKLDLFYYTVAILCLSTIAVYASIWAFESTLILERSEHQTTFNPQIWWFKWTVVISLILVVLQSFSKIIKLLTQDGE